MKNLFLVCFAMLTVTFLPLVSQASVIVTFEGEYNTIYESPITRSDFDFGNPSGQEQHFHEIMSTEYGLPDNGTGVLLNDRDTEIFVKSHSPSQFSLGDVDVASALSNNPAVGLVIYGYLSGSLTGTISLATLGTGYTTLNGASLGNIDQLIFDGIGGYGGFIIDNINFNPSSTSVPEPATMLLLGLGLVGLAGARRKFKK